MKRRIIIHGDLQKQHAIDLIDNLLVDPVHEVVIRVFKDSRSIRQNRLQFMWCNEAAEQLKEDTSEGYRAYCKLHFGVPILRNEDEDFREKYDAVVGPLPYETKLKLMTAPFDFPVTRLMNVGQMRRYLDMVWHHFSELGANLTEPEDRRDVWNN